ncbi:MAG: NAD-dependent epimerase/dehydratase family protein [Oscillospiraceae bacterium]|nr:NAD-dependent epimerase/dehydratase family protein [Oscillospiraceae bacterium]
MKILVIGGTRFMGKHLVRSLIADGHDVTIATRGITPDNFGPTVNRVVIDRTNVDSIKTADT